MIETLINTLLPLLGTFLGSVVSILVSNKMTTYRLEQLEKKVDKHNHLVERMVKAEASTASAHRRLDEHINTK